MQVRVQGRVDLRRYGRGLPGSGFGSLPESFHFVRKLSPGTRRLPGLQRREVRLRLPQGRLHHFSRGPAECRVQMQVQRCLDLRRLDRALPGLELPGMQGSLGRQGFLPGGRRRLQGLPPVTAPPNDSGAPASPDAGAPLQRPTSSADVELSHDSSMAAPSAAVQCIRDGPRQFRPARAAAAPQRGSVASRRRRS